MAALRKRSLPGKNALLFFLLIFSAIQLKAQTDISIGTGTAGNTATSYPCPIQDRFEGMRAQYLYRASELMSAGMGAGNISAIKFNVVTLGTVTVGVVEQYTIKITTTAASSLSATGWEPGVTTVYGPVNYQPVVGLNSFTLTTPFFWNGMDNLVVEVCNGDPNSGASSTWTNNPVISWTTGLSFNGSRTYRADNEDNLCGTLATTEHATQTTRPNIVFTWTAAANCAGTPAGGTATSTASVVCSGTPFTLGVTGTPPATGINYQWQSSSDNTNWNDIVGATTANYIRTQTTTTYYRVKVTCTNGGAFDFSSSVLVTTPTAVSGTFTINSAVSSGGTNFQSFNDAYNYIKCGIAGPVVFNVVTGSGPYNEQLIMQAVPGASATNTITFNGNGATLSFTSTNTNERGIIKLDGADHITFDSLVINATGTTTAQYGFGVHLINNADSNTIRKCIINLSTTTTSTNYAGIVVSSSATSATTTGNTFCDGNTFTQNTITGGYYGITLVGSTTAANVIQNNKVTENTIRDFYIYGIYVAGTISSLIEANDISRPVRTDYGATSYGVYFTNLSTRAQISKNRVHSMFESNVATTDDLYGIYLTGVDATAGNENVISNNAIYDIRSNGIIYGIYNASSDHARYYHNTISLDDAASTSTAATRGFYQLTSATGIQLRNNLISISRGGTGTKHAIYMGTAATTYSSNYNDLYIVPGATHHVGYNGSNQTTLANWQSATSQDANSVSINPVFLDATNGNLRPTAATLDNKGTPVGITTDILNAPRSATTPDIGAYEFTVGVCTTPPTPGTATSDASGPICPNTAVALNLTGNSIGTGQTYQWESSASLTGPWTPVGGVLTNPALNVNPTITLYYRVAVTCSGSTTFSVPVQVVVNSFFPGGTYTINKNVATGGTNFQSFNDAYDAMKCGIAGPVIFNVVSGSGPYTEQLIMQDIQGTSAINTITFNGNGNTISFLSTNTSERAVIKLNGTDHVTFNDLVIVATGTTTSEYGFGIQLMNDADSNTVNNCTININTTSTSTNYAGLVVSISATSAVGTGNNECDYNTFSNNTITGGYYGLTLIGSSAVANGNNKILNNNISEFYQYGIYVNGSFNTRIEANRISRPTRSTVTAFYGIYFTALSTRANITRNVITNPFGGAPTNTNTFYGIYHNASDPLPTFENLVTNNAIYNLTGSGDTYGIYNASSNNTWYYHNTISMDGDATASTATTVTRGFYQTTQADGLEFKNNIITISRGGPGPKHAIYFNTITSTIVSDRNDLYRSPVAANAFVGFYSANRATLSDWQTASSQDANSIASDPIYANHAAGNLEPTNASIDNLGTPVGVTVDIMNDPRSATTPDIGAWEFFPGGCTAPPTAGTASALPDTVCQNSNVALKLTGNSTGIGQTYQWETSSTLAGPYTAIGNVLNNPDTVIVASTTLYYRVAVTCSGNTSFSTPVLLFVNPALPAGTYTINATIPASATNFVSFNAAKAAMACGIAGPVVFNVVPGSGPYNEQLILDSIQGTSAINTITFNGNGNIIKFSSSNTNERAVIKLRRTDHVIFDSLTIDATGAGTYGYGVQLINNADSNTFRKCTILAVSNSTSTNYSGVIVNSSETGQTTTGNTLSDGNTFDRNSVIGGYYGFTLVGSTTAALAIKENRITNNTIQDFYSYGIYVSGTNNSLIEGNNISRPARTGVTTTYGIYFTGLSSNALISKNRIHNPFAAVPTTTSAFYGIYITGVDAPAGSDNVVVNNAVYNITGNGIAYGLFNSSSNNVKYYHNTISLDHAASTATVITRGFYQTTEASGIVLKNNIITIKRGGTGEKHVLYFATAASTTISNRNDLYIAPGANNFIGYNGTDRVTLANWQTATTQDANSVSVDPLYTDPVGGDLTPQISPVDNLGEPLGITTDIMGASRSATTPDIGAWEFNIPPCTTPPNAGTSVATPNSGICLGSPITLTLTGHSSGGTQTYQWQNGPSATGPWTNISGVQYTPVFNTTVGLQTFFRAEVICNGNTAHSVPVQVVLNPSFLAGTYTINNTLPTSGTNFNSFTDAVAALECGITGTVIFNVAPGTYTEQIRMHAIAGTSSTSRVIFRSANGNPASVNLTFNATNAAANYVLKLDSASYISYNAITITPTNTTNGRAVEFANTASYDSLANCIITLPTTTSATTNVVGIFADDLRGTDLVIRKNTINNGAAGIYIAGVSTAALTERHQIDSNTVNNAYEYGIYTSFTGRVQMKNNTVNVTAPNSTSAYGIYATNADSAYQFVKNLVNINNTTATIYGIYLTASDASALQMGRVANNKVVAVTNNTGHLYGLYQTGSSYNNSVNNVLSVKTSGATSYGLYSTVSNNVNYFNNSVHSTATSATNNVAAYFNHTSVTNGNVDIRNNVFSHGGGGRAMQLTNINYIYSDYNTFYTTGASLIQWGTNNYATLQQWRDTSTWDFNSIVYKPAFISDTDLQPDVSDPNVWAMHGRGEQIAGNNYDFNDNPRPTTLTTGVPDMGAYEFLPTSTPPALVPVPATPAAGVTQVFMFGTDTVTKISWAPGSAVPSTIELRRYSGVLPPGMPASFKPMYFYTDVDVTGAGPFNYNIRQYYIDPWQGFIPDEATIRLGRTDPANVWVREINSTVDDIGNIISKTGLTTLDKFTGIEGDNVVSPVDITPVDNSNKGTKFWVAYGHHQFMEAGWSNEQEMVLYLGAEQPATVTVRINGTNWSKTYSIPANTVITSNIIPKTGLFDARLTREGLSKRGISIVSDVPITAYAHIFGNLSSGATMLMPVGTYGYEYYALTSRQNYGDDAHSWFYVIADRDNTVVEITPSNPTVGGRLPGVPFTVTLKKGEVYQVLGAIQSGNEGYDLTGSRIRSVANAQGKCYAVAVFSGSSRTNIACGGGPGSFSGDNIIQQNFPFQAWGKKYLTAPTSASTAAATLNINIYRVAVKDPTTVVRRNGVVLTGLINNYYYQFESNTADYIDSDKPIMVAQYIPSSFSSNCPGITGTGDPEMMYISPLEQGIKQVALYRNTDEAITVNYLTLIIPTTGVPSLRIDGSATFDHSYAHPNFAGYTVVVKRWTAAKAQAIVQSDSAFTAITYGMGAQESYGYNAGTLVRNLNAQPAILNVFNTGGTSSDYTCSGTPFRVHVLIPIKPTTLEWQFSQVNNISPNVNVTQTNPVPVDSVVINGVKYYKFTVNQDYTITGTGTFYLPIAFSHPDIESCNNRLETALAISVIAAPVSNFTVNFSGCIGDIAQFNATASTSNGVIVDRWRWDFGDATTSTIQNPTKQYTTAGTYNVNLMAIARDGCIDTTIKPVVVNALPTTTLVQDSLAVCAGSNATFTIQNPPAGATYNWYNTLTGGTPVHTGSSFTVNNVTTSIAYYVEVTLNGCVGSPRKRVVATVLPPLSNPVATVDSTGTNTIRFRWTAVPNAASYEVSTNGGSTWSTPSSGPTGLTHTVTGLQPLQQVSFRVRAIGVISCQTATSLDVSGRTLPDQIFIPNAFTPNGDGLNDVLRVYGYTIREMHFMVFNQWGEKVFESRSQSQGWDGRHKNKVQPAGVYVYVCRLTLTDGRVEMRRGSINLIR